MKSIGVKTHRGFKNISKLDLSKTIQDINYINLDQVDKLNISTPQNIPDSIRNINNESTNT